MIWPSIRPCYGKSSGPGSRGRGRCRCADGQSGGRHDAVLRKPAHFLPCIAFACSITFGGKVPWPRQFFRSAPLSSFDGDVEIPLNLRPFRHTPLVCAIAPPRHIRPRFRSLFPVFLRPLGLRTKRCIFSALPDQRLRPGAERAGFRNQ